MVYPQLRTKPSKNQFVPKMYGFKIHEFALDKQLKKGEEIDNQRKRAENAVYQATKKAQKMQYLVQSAKNAKNQQNTKSIVQNNNNAIQVQTSSNKNIAPTKPSSQNIDPIQKSQDTVQTLAEIAQQNDHLGTRTLSQKLSSNLSNNSTNNPLINNVQNMEILTMGNNENVIWQSESLPPSYHSTQIAGNLQTTGDYDPENLDHAITATEKLVLNEAGEGVSSLQ